MPGALVIYLQGKQQLCIRLLYESVAGQCELATQFKCYFWCCSIDTKGAVFLLIFINEY